MELDKELLNYLGDPEIFGELKLVSSGSIRFHWANWDQLLDHLQDRVIRGGEIQSYENVKDRLENYKKTPVWIFNKSGNIQSNIYELYNYYLDPRLRELWFEINEETLVSFKGTSGPFIRLQSMRWFDSEIYKVFIFDRLLENKGIPQRGFRINVKIPLECSFEETVLEPLNAEIVQLSKEGVLVRFPQKTELVKLENHDDIIFTANLNPFKRAKDKSIEDMGAIFTEKAFAQKSKAKTRFRLKSNILELGSNQYNLTFSNGNDAFLFFSYNDLIDIDKKKIKDSMIEVVQLFENYASEHLKKVAA